MIRKTWPVVLAAVLAVAGVQGAANAQSNLLKELENAFVRLHEEVRPSVVNIDTKGKVEREGAKGQRPELEDLFRFFGVPDDGGQGPMPMRPRPERRATGSGFLYDADGHIVTNNHVVEDARAITVRLWNGNEYDAEVVGRDPDTDLAVVKIEAEEDLPVAKLGDSETLKTGQFAVALGSPRGFEGSLSFGHVSALGRENLAGLSAQGLRFQNLIQTDAAINLGNSGGPLVNIDGEVIGINIAIVWGANSLGFAIPVNTAKDIVPQLISEGKVTRGYLGVQIMDASEFAGSLGLPDDSGAFVKEVQPDTPAARADLKTYDVIRKVNGESIETAQDLVTNISALDPGEKANLEVWRDEELMKVTVKLEEWDPGEMRVSADTSVLGLDLRSLTPELAQRLGLGEDARGVLVTEVKAGSAADDAGLSRGDVITEAGREPVRNPEDFKRIISDAGAGKSVIIRFQRGDVDSMTVLEVPAE